MVRPILQNSVANHFRFDASRGVAGQVVLHNKIVNIKDVYSYPHFNPDGDKVSGYSTKSILCGPIVPVAIRSPPRVPPSSASSLESRFKIKDIIVESLVV